MKHMERYKNKICLITASSTGIGFAIALKMASEGGTVIISSRNKENVEKSVEKIRQAGFNAIGFTFHVGNKIQRANLMKFIQEKFGKLDVLVLNAAVNPHVGDQFEITESKMDKIYEINIKSTFFLIQESLFLMKKGENPNILMISTFGVYNINTNIAFYTVSKLAINAMMKTLARQLNKEGIRVNTLAPGFTRTKFSEIMHKYDEKSLDFRRLGEVEDVANAAAFLCSKEADYIVGEIFTLAGFVNSRL